MKPKMIWNKGWISFTVAVLNQELLSRAKRGIWVFVCAAIPVVQAKT
jgi:hypothetical protein